MTKRKTWIKVKRGILEPKHRIELGIRVWLYLHILDRADWETGTILEWIDGSEAEVMSISINTLRKQRKQLQESGYITAVKGKHSQTIIIHNWTDPRKYDGLEINKSSQNLPLSENQESPLESPQELPLESPLDYTANDDPSLYPHTTSHKSNKNNSDRPPSVELCKRIIYRFPHKSLWKTLDRKIGRDFISLLKWGRLLRHWKLQGWNPTNFKGMLDAFSRNDKDNPADFDSEIARQEMDKSWEQARRTR